MKNLQQVQSQNNQLSMLQVAEIQVSYHPHFKANERPKLTTSKGVFDVLLNHWNPGAIQMKEEFKIVLLNRNNRVLGIFNVSSGGTAGTIVDLKILFNRLKSLCFRNYS